MSEKAFGSQSMVGALKSVLVYRPTPMEYNTANWIDYGYDGLPDQPLATVQHNGFTHLLEVLGVSVQYMTEASNSLQTTATFDAALVTDHGAIILNSGKIQRRAEASAMTSALAGLNIPIIGSLKDDCYADGGDLIWLDAQTVVAGHSYRTNDAGIKKLSELLSRYDIAVLTVELPHWKGPKEVLHLMTVINLVSPKLAVAYERAVPLRLMKLLEAKGIEVICVPEEEFETQGANVLAITPKSSVMCSGSPKTQALLEGRGVEVHTFDGSEFCFRRGAGPTCHALPLLRESVR